MYCADQTTTASVDYPTFGYDDYALCREYYDDWEEIITNALHIHPWMLESNQERFNYRPSKEAPYVYNRSLYLNAYKAGRSPPQS